MAKVTVAEDGCWNWTGSTDGHGYGQVNWPTVRRSPLKAHRLSYEHFVGPIPNGLTVDHLCRHRLCVNPEHLEAITGAENTRRGLINDAVCKNGHPRTAENTYETPAGKRFCKDCKRERARRVSEALGLVHNGLKTHCPRGHEYTPENTYVKPSTGHRDCRICIRDRSKRLVEKRTRVRAEANACVCDPGLLEFEAYDVSCPVHGIEVLAGCHA